MPGRISSCDTFDPDSAADSLSPPRAPSPRADSAFDAIDDSFLPETGVSNRRTSSPSGRGKQWRPIWNGEYVCSGEEDSGREDDDGTAPTQLGWGEPGAPLNYPFSIIYADLKLHSGPQTVLSSAPLQSYPALYPQARRLSNLFEPCPLGGCRDRPVPCHPGLSSSGGSSLGGSPGGSQGLGGPSPRGPGRLG